MLPEPRPAERPADFLVRVGTIFATFDAQDSGNVSYGVDIRGACYFVKTAGDREGTAFLRHTERTALLHNAARLASSVRHPALPAFHGVLGFVEDPLLVYDWREGEHLGTTTATRDDPDTAFQRFRALPALEICTALDTLYDLHLALSRAGWVEGDFYDGALLYDFGARRLTAVDLDSYRLGAYGNDVGRMFGSSRFMAPEELELGALVDDRTTVYVMARTALVLLSDGSLDRAPFRGAAAQLDMLRQAVAPAPADRHVDLASFHDAWRRASQPWNRPTTR